MRTLLVMMLTGCSFLFVRVPPEGSPRTSYDCSALLPVVDTALAVASVVVLVAAVSVPAGCSECGDPDPAIVAVPAGIGVAYVASAIYGETRYETCVRRRDAASP